MFFQTIDDAETVLNNLQLQQPKYKNIVEMLIKLLIDALHESNGETLAEIISDVSQEDASKFTKKPEELTPCESCYTAEGFLKRIFVHMRCIPKSVRPQSYLLFDERWLASDLDPLTYMSEDEEDDNSFY